MVPNGTPNVAPGAIDIDDAQAMADRFGPPEDFDSGSQEPIVSKAKPVRAKSKSTASRNRVLD